MINGLHSGRKAENGKLFSQEYVERKSIFGRYSNAELLGQLKRLARNPCDAEFSHDKIVPLWNQTLQVRRVMALCDTAFPRRKRMLEHFCKDKLSGSLPYVDGDIRKAKKRRLSYAASTSCVLKSTDNAESLGQKITMGLCDSTSLSTFEDDFQDNLFLDDAMDWNLSAKNLMTFVDSSESTNDSTQLSPKNLRCHALDSFDGTQISGKKHHLQSARLSTKILNFIGDISQRSVIPVGSRFQADVPEWSLDSLNKAGHNGEDGHCNNSRWLGTQIWPSQCRMETSTRVVGEGRSDSCCCASPGSSECIRRHILEERLVLQWDLGPAFFTWKFDEMGEQTVIKSWAVKEQKTFEALLKDPQAKGKNFLKHALVSLPRKSSKAIVSYYFNVFVPRWISQQTRSGHKVVDSDEEVDDSSYMMKYGKGPRGRGIPTSSRGCKTRYLRQPS